MDAGSCGATVTASAILLANAYLAQGTIGMGGYAYAFSDMVVPGGSTSCVDQFALCTLGTTGTQNPPDYTVYGAGIGVNLNQDPSATSVGTFAATGNGIAYTLSNLPAQGVRLIIDDGGDAGKTTYCVDLTTSTGQIPWSQFSTQCYNLGNPGAALSGAPSSATSIQFLVIAGSKPGPFDFCVTSLAFM
jgi:hypothetical protein